MTCKKLIKLFICLVFFLTGLNASAQVAILQNTIDRLESYKNFSYRSVNQQKEIFASNTVVERYNAIFVKESSNKNFGYLFNVQTVNENNNVIHAELYNGQNLVYITPGDSSYTTQDINEFNSPHTLPGFLKWLHGRLEKKSTKITNVNDTTINGVDSYHITANVYDTVINKERNYTFADLYINKLSGAPILSIIRSRNTTYGTGVSTFYSKSSYSDYKFDQNDIDTASFTKPKGYRLPAKPPILIPLAPGTVAPDWSLYDTEGKKMSLSQMKGKVILLDFFYIGCFPCMESLKTLDNLHEKYKNQNFVIVSISDRDSNKQVRAFKKNYNVNYPMYGNAADVGKLYHIIAAPTFYFIDKEGKISSFRDGYSDDFEQKMSAIIDNLLKKS